jgi:hypothetical protein
MRAKPEKFCKGCNLFLNRVEFSLRKKGGIAINALCRKCHSKKNGRDSQLELNRSNYHKNKNNFSEEKIKQRKETTKIWQKTLAGRYSCYKFNAKAKQVEFNLSISEFEKITNRKCYYCNEFTINKQYCGIDRADNNLGYTVENSISCCCDCNVLKSDRNKEEFINLIFKIANNLKEIL